MSIACAPTFHRHAQTCARCGTTEGNVAATVTRDGNRWPPLCGQCASRVQKQSKRDVIAVLEAHEARA
jgi:hypothetical protein